MMEPICGAEDLQDGSGDGRAYLSTNVDVSRQSFTRFHSLQQESDDR